MNEQESKLHEEIIAEAKSKAEHLLARARNEADGVIGAAREAARQKREERLAEAREVAAKRSHAIVSGVELETARRWLLSICRARKRTRRRRAKWNRQ